MADKQLHNRYTDEELLQRYRRTGDNKWMGILLQQYTLLLLGVAMKYLKDKTQAEDAVQQVFYKALTHLPDGDMQNFKGWLYILMRNHCFQLLRDKNYPVDEAVLQSVPAPESDEKALLEKETTLAQLEAAIHELPDEQQQTITLFYLKKCSYKEITDVTGYSFMQVKSYIQNGKRNLKLILQKRSNSRP